MKRKSRGTARQKNPYYMKIEVGNEREVINIELEENYSTVFTLDNFLPAMDGGDYELLSNCGHVTLRGNIKSYVRTAR